MLAGGFSRSATFDVDDFRSTLPKFQGENFEHNLVLVDALKEFGAARKCTPGQAALAWLLAQPHDIVPIPGAKRMAHVRENFTAASVPLSADDVAYLAELFDPAHIKGARYGALNARPRPS
jgi:aryl-alcohol dehydrogenase-like predicted oxidoreductase